MGESGVATVMFTDLVDSTGLLERLGEREALRFQQDHLALLRKALAEHGGDEIKSLGDGLMAVFVSAGAAVRAAVAMQQAVATDQPAVGLRIGLDAGELLPNDGDLFGTAVVVARRLCDTGVGSQIHITDLVRTLVGDQLEVDVTPLGPTQLKGLTTPVTTWLVHWAEAERASAAPAVPRRTGVVIADDQRLVRAGLRVILESEPDLRVLGEAGDGLEAIELVRRTAPDVVLMDIRMPRMDGLEAARRLIESTAARVVMLTTFDADEYVYSALQLGASGFLLKDSPPEQLVAAVRAAASGDALIDPAVTRRLISHFSGAATLAAAPAVARSPDNELPEELRQLTARELDVLRLVARGLSNAEIAAELVVEESTVKTHVARILTKLGVRDRVQAVVRAYESGFILTG